MINVDKPVEVRNMETMQEFLEDENGSGLVYEHSGFLDLHEPEILDEFTFRRMQRESKKYGYAVTNN